MERPPATVLLVRDPDSAQLNRMLSRNNPGTGVHLGPDDRVGLVWPLSHDVKIGEQEAQLLESTPYFTDKEAGLFWVLTRVSRPKKSIPPYRYADAVAVAAIEAYRSGAPRAVVLVSRASHDASQLTVEQVRGYLSTLGVPLHVWSYGPTTSPWGEAKPLTSFVGISARGHGAQEGPRQSADRLGRGRVAAGTDLAFAGDSGRHSGPLADALRRERSKPPEVDLRFRGSRDPRPPGPFRRGREPSDPRRATP